MCIYLLLCETRVKVEGEMEDLFKVPGKRKNKKCRLIKIDWNREHPEGTEIYPFSSSSSGYCQCAALKILLLQRKFPDLRFANDRGELKGSSLVLPLTLTCYPLLCLMFYNSCLYISQGTGLWLCGKDSWKQISAGFRLSELKYWISYAYFTSHLEQLIITKWEKVEQFYTNKR